MDLVRVEAAAAELHGIAMDAEQMMTAAITAIRAQVLKEMPTQTPAAAPQRNLLTAAQSGEYLGRSEHAVTQLIFKRQLPAIRFGRSVRLQVNDLDQFTADNRV
jgi:excisionase family DNA binding protein